ncbi:MAG TPA: PD-(D/E)XK nuclease superfamily protein [Pyrinomonadaceae bacterium]|nr:PD-(D/E)XK nuclease superfamily protein [Pyrinomonadaceae bacterium]
MVLPALEAGGYECAVRVKVGHRLGQGAHIVDVVATKEERRILVSLKWQQVSGTAEQKIPFEVICLASTMNEGVYDKAYLVLGGEGWKLRSFYTTGGLKKYLTGIESVEILTLESFVAKANRGQL